MRFEDGHKSLMRGMRDVGLDAGFVFERDEEAVREAVVLVLRTDIRAPLKSSDDIDLRWQCAEAVLDGLDRKSVV